VRDLSLAVYNHACRHAESRGIIIADTKFEFGRDARGLVLGDEVLTPDSSRFWPADTYKPGGAQASLDKQFVRDYLESIHWDKNPPAPKLPDEIVEGARQRYVDIFRRLSGRELE
jgi:phosphoribosylaminoimidazole-succinocarboxamide synthase